MLKIYAKREEELRLLPILAEFKARVVANYPIKGRLDISTRKIRGKNAYKITNFPINEEFDELREAYTKSKNHI